MSKNKKSKKVRQDVPTCIFCKSTPVTFEHLWPQWIEKEFSKVGEDKHVVNNFQSFSPDGSRGEYNSRILNRNIVRLVVKKVCASCNNGWMSKIESESMEIIKSLVDDRSIMLGADEQSKLSKWAVLKAIIGAYADRSNKVVIKQKERQSFFENGAPSANFSVWIGRSMATENFWKQPLFIHYTAYANSQNLILSTSPDHNAQWSLFVFKAFVIIVFWCEILCELLLPPLVADKLFQIYPQTIASINSHSIPTLSDFEMEYIRQNLNKHSKALVDK